MLSPISLPALLRPVAFLAVIGLATALAPGAARSGTSPDDAILLALDTVRDDPLRATEIDMKTKPDDTRTDTALTVDGGRVTQIDIGAGPGDAVRIVDAPDHGHLSVAPDGSLALVLSGSDYRGRLDFSVEIDRGGGVVDVVDRVLSVSAPEQAKGWGAGSHYTLRTDADGDSIAETGDVHRAVYASGGPGALSVDDIAAAEGIPAARINGAWLAGHPDYGTQDRPLDPEAAEMLWNAITTDGPSSHHLLLERGHDYDLQRVIAKGVSGESELAPVHVGAWGTGTQPRIVSEQRIFQAQSENIFIDDVAFTQGFDILAGNNILFEDVTMTGRGFNIQKVDNFTLRDSLIADVALEAPSNGSEWQPHKDRQSGIFASKVDGLLLEGNLFHHNGWEDGYRTDGRGGVQPPSKYSHNVYVQFNSSDVTFRDNIAAQGASFGAQIRPGGHVADNLLLDNNIGLNVLGGQKNKGSFDGNFSVLLGNVVTSAGHLKADKAEGALARGIDNDGLSTTLIDNIVAHLANPADAKEKAEKTANNGPLRHLQDPETDDTIVYNWTTTAKVYQEQNQIDRNVDGLDGRDLDAVTIQAYAAGLLGGDRGTIDDLLAYLRGLYGDGGDASDVSGAQIAGWFLDGFGRGAPSAAGGDARFVPQSHSDGIRWDNRLNWSEDRLPGETADLAGNRVIYSGTSVLDRVDLGAGGALSVGQGYLRLRDGFAAGPDGGRVEVDGAGQVWTSGGTGPLTYQVAGGRLVFDGPSTSEALAIDARDGQVVLTGGARLELGAGDAIVLRGQDARIGFDGAGGSAVLDMSDDAVLAFAAEGGRFGRLGEFHSGAFGEAPDIASRVNLDGVLSLDLSDLSPPGGRAVETVLLEADEITGRFDRVEIAGLQRTQSADLVLDYDADTLVLKVQGGQGGVEFSTIGGPDGDPGIDRGGDQDGPAPGEKPQEDPEFLQAEARAAGIDVAIVDPLPDFEPGLFAY